MLRRRRKSDSSHDKDPAVSGPTSEHTSVCQSRMKTLCGFELCDFQSWDSFVNLLNRPTDPSNLAVMRIVYGLFMIMDIPFERGMASIERDFLAEKLRCRFPLFDWLEPLPVQWMYVVYWIMLAGAIGVMLGFLFRLSCLALLIPYWYIFFLDKTAWNNHSYLFGLCAFLFLLSDANRYWSVDGLIWKKKYNANIPLWNYGLFRTQFFMVYFIAGLKKLDYDWRAGYSMLGLSRHWVFLPFTVLLTNEQIDFLVVHCGGLFIDLFMGFFLFFDKTRLFGFIIGGSFHFMNSRIFNIGMFPYTMFATMPLFSADDWPKRLIERLPRRLQRCLPSVDSPQFSPHCIYTQIPDANVKKDNGKSKKESPSEPVSLYHRISAVVVIVYISWQCFMPYSHFITRGYNNWTNGLYGYSWDMMVHSWSTQHVKLEYLNLDDGTVGYLNHYAFLASEGNRWGSHADMVKQFAVCLKEKLKTWNLTNIELHMDIWRSMNGRFQQRIFDPRVDMITAEWHPLKPTPWVMPLLVELSSWRDKLKEMEKGLISEDKSHNVVFVADFPGLSLENYVHPDLTNTSLTVLKGTVTVEMDGVKETVHEGSQIQLMAGEFHQVHTTSDEPSCYMYVFINTTEVELMHNISEYQKVLKESGATDESDVKYNDYFEKEDTKSVREKIYDYFQGLSFVLSRVIVMSLIAGYSIATQQDFNIVANNTEMAQTYYIPQFDNLYEIQQ